MRFVLPLYLLLLLWLNASILHAKESAAYPYFKGPIPAHVIRVIDGDTVLVNAYPWPMHSIRVYVRLRDIDAPELRSKCVPEREAAIKAKEALAQILNNQTISLYEISGGKYYGRVIAHISIDKNQTASNTLLKQGHAIAYKKRRGYWANKFKCVNS